MADMVTLETYRKMESKKNKRIEELEKENTDLRDNYEQFKAIAEPEIERLKKENAELRNNGFTVSAMTEQQLRVALEKGEQLEKDFRICEKNADTYYDQLTKAKELLKKMYYLYFDPCVTNKDLENRDKLFEEVKQIIQEIEK